jgi:hypothetical protein
MVPVKRPVAARLTKRAEGHGANAGSRNRFYQNVVPSVFKAFARFQRRNEKCALGRSWHEWASSGTISDRNPTGSFRALRILC